MAALDEIEAVRRMERAWLGLVAAGPLKEAGLGAKLKAIGQLASMQPTVELMAKLRPI